VGGRLCVGLRKSFWLRNKEWVIKDSIVGEDCSMFNETVLDLLEAVPELGGDQELGATNEGVTILWLKRGPLGRRLTTLTLLLPRNRRAIKLLLH
jgi:hypothetical protein